MNCQMNSEGYAFLEGGLGVLPQKIFGFEGHMWCIQMHFGVNLPQYPYPHFLKKMLFRFTLNSKKLKSDLSLKILSRAG